MSDLEEAELELESRAPGRPGMPIDLARLVRALTRHWRWLVGVAVVSAAIGAILAKTIAPKTYTARSVIVWEPAQPTPGHELSTLIDSMLIPANLNEVKRRLKLGVPIEALALWIQVFFDPQSDVVSVEASASGAKTAKDLANTLIAVFLDNCQNIRRSRNEAALQELRANLDVARAVSRTAQEVYDTFRRENNVIDVSQETALAIQEAATLRSRAEAAKGEAQAEAARARLLEEDARHESAFVVTSRSTQNPRASALAAARLELDQARTRLSADHPRIAALEAQVLALQSGDNGDVESVSSGQNAQLAAIRSALAQASTARAAAAERQQAHTEQAAEARERLAKLSAVEGQAAILLSEVTNAADHVKELEAQVGPMEAAVRNTKAEFRVLAPADEPTSPSSGKGKVYAAGVPAISLSLLLAVLLGLELRGLRIKTPREAAFWIHGPSLGATTWPNATDNLVELLDEVSDCAGASTGTTLIVGASAGDERAALEIAHGIRSRIQAASGVTAAPFATRALIGNGESSRTTLSDGVATTEITKLSEPAPTASVANIQTWDSGNTKVTLRRASRLADRVVVVVTANTIAMPRLASIGTRLGRDHGVGVILIGQDPALSDLPDRVGDVDGFWFTNDYEEASSA